MTSQKFWVKTSVICAVIALCSSALFVVVTKGTLGLYGLDEFLWTYDKGSNPPQIQIDQLLRMSSSVPVITEDIPDIGYLDDAPQYLLSQAAGVMSMQWNNTPSNIYLSSEDIEDLVFKELLSLLENGEFDLGRIELWTGGRDQLRGTTHYVDEGRPQFKAWMDYRAITSESSRQWKLQQIAYTCEQGLRRIDGMPMIALGTYYMVRDIGDVFEITLDSGVVFRAVLGDVKADEHTDLTNRYTLNDGSVVEFIIDRPYMEDKVKVSGDVSWLGFPGAVVKIEYIPEIFIEP